MRRAKKTRWPDTAAPQAVACASLRAARSAALRAVGSAGLRAVAPAALLVAAMAAAGPAELHAQAGAGGALVQSYTFGTPEAAGLERFTLTTLPFAAEVPLGGFASVDVSGAWAEGRARGPDGAEARLNGLTDTQVGFALTLGRDRVVLRSTLSLPTGQDVVTFEESAVAAVVAAELLPFAINTWGSGGGAGGDMALAFQAGGWGVGIGGGYWAGRSFDPGIDAGGQYRPGDQIQARLALDRDVGSSGTFSLIVGMQRFGEDALDGANLFRSGDRYEGLASYTFAVGMRGSALVYGGAYHRERGSLLVDTPTLEGATSTASQQLFMAGTNLLLPLSNRISLLPDAGVRVFRSGDGVGQGWLGTVGAALDVRLAGPPYGRRLVLSPSGAARLGRVVVREGSRSDIVGWEAGVTLRMVTGR